MTDLSVSEIWKLVNQYIGVHDGHLGDFSFPSLADFYPEFCGLDIDIDSFEGTKRQRFIDILKTRNSEDQAKILRGVVKRFPIGGYDAPPTRTDQLKCEFLGIAGRLESSPEFYKLAILSSMPLIRCEIREVLRIRMISLYLKLRLYW